MWTPKLEAFGLKFCIHVKLVVKIEIYGHLPNASIDDATEIDKSQCDRYNIDLRIWQLHYNLIGPKRFPIA